MRDSEFIALLNLYLDHEISPEDTARLESEVARDPRRREVYRQYCRMQKACSVIGQEFAETEARQDVVAEALAPRCSAGVPAALWLGGLAAAGFAVVALVGRRAPAFPASAPAVAVVQPAPSKAGSGALQPVFVARSGPAGISGSTQLLPPAGLDTQFAWMNSVQLTPIAQIPADKLMPEAKSGLEFDSRGLDGQAPQQPSADTTAFQFQK